MQVTTSLKCVSIKKEINLTCTFSSDNEDPIIHDMPGDIFQPVTECGNAIVHWTEPSVTDNSGYSTLFSNYAPEESMPYGVTTVTYTAEDGSGKTVSESMTVTIIKETGRRVIK